VLQGFVAGLSAGDEALLRGLLDDADPSEDVPEPA
jgi:hypothetical protein